MCCKSEPKIIENSYCRPSLSLSLFSLPLSFPFLPLSLLFITVFPPPFPFYNFPSLPLEIGALKSSQGSQGALQARPVGSGAEPKPKSNLMHFSLKKWQLVATVLKMLLHTWGKFLVHTRYFLLHILSRKTHYFRPYCKSASSET